MDSIEIPKVSYSINELKIQNKFLLLNLLSLTKSITYFQKQVPLCPSLINAIDNLIKNINIEIYSRWILIPQRSC